LGHSVKWLGIQRKNIVKNISQISRFNQHWWVWRTDSVALLYLYFLIKLRIG
jgi:hypothetical protein